MSSGEILRHRDRSAVFDFSGFKRVFYPLKPGLTRRQPFGSTTGPQSVLKPRSSIMRVRRV